jgi:hypothetical protein
LNAHVIAHTCVILQNENTDEEAFASFSETVDVNSAHQKLQFTQSLNVQYVAQCSDSDAISSVIASLATSIQAELPAITTIYLIEIADTQCCGTSRDV